MNIRISGISDKIKPAKLIKELDHALAVCGDPLLNLTYDISEDNGMPCFDCEAFRDDEQCYNKRHTVDENGIEGMGCPRIKKMIEGVST